MKNRLMLLILLAFTMQTAPMGNFARKATRVAGKAAKATCITVGGITGTSVLGLGIANQIATDFNKLEPHETPENQRHLELFQEEGEEEYFKKDMNVETHDEATRNEIGVLAARLKFTPEDFSRIRTFYDRKTDPHDSFHSGKSKERAEAEIEAIHTYLVHSNGIYSYRYNSSAHQSFQCISRANFIITSKKPEAFYTLHELVHARRINHNKITALSPKARWWYLLHEEFRADLEALQVATPEEIQDFIKYKKNNLASLSPAGLTIEWETPTDTQSYVVRRNPTFPDWMDTVPKSLQLYARDAYVNLEGDKPHPPTFFRIAMAQCALFCKKTARKIGF